LSLKELTAEKHKAAESTPFMKAVFAKTLPKDIWIDWTYQKALFYNVIEAQCKVAGYLDDLPGIERTHLLMKDYREMIGDNPITNSFKSPTIGYYRYILGLDSKATLAHLYTWHMGDMFGGQAIKKIVDAPHSSLEFDNPMLLMTNLRSKLSDDLGPEANTAFDWAIKIMSSYNV
jgi:heme oxygenase